MKSKNLFAIKHLFVNNIIAVHHRPVVMSLLKAKFHYAILVTDRSEAGRRPAVSWNLAYH